MAPMAMSSPNPAMPGGNSALAAMVPMLQMLLQFLLSLQQPGGASPLGKGAANGDLVKEIDKVINTGFVNGKQFLTAADLKGTPLEKFVDAFMFAKIDPTNEAWRGVSKTDLEIIRGRILGGESPDKISGNIQADLLATRSDLKKGESFADFVARRRKESGV
jgi:hypothetical protein